MPTVREIQKRINSVRETQKITNAMYLIASTKLQRARKELDSTRPYFEALLSEIKRVFRVNRNIESRYFYPPGEDDDHKGMFLCWKYLLTNIVPHFRSPLPVVIQNR